MTSVLPLLLALSIAAGSDVPANAAPGASTDKSGGQKSTLAPRPKPDAVPVATQPASSELNPWATGMTEEEIIGKILAIEVGGLIRDGRKKDALAAVEHATDLLEKYTSDNDIAEWDPEAARLFQLADSRRSALKGGSPGGKLTREQLKQLSDYRRDVMAATAMANRNELAEAQAKVNSIMDSLDEWVTQAKVPAWHRSVAPVYQQAADLLDELDAATGKSEKETGKKDRMLKAGDPAPPFSVMGLNGKPLSSKQLAGKWVVVTFWATWCSACRKEMPNLRELQATFGDDDRFALVSLSIDDNPSKPRAYIQENDLKWTHGFLGQGWRAPLLQKYGVTGIPAVFLVSPQGGIAGTGLRGSTLHKAVGQVLGKSSLKGSGESTTGRRPGAPVGPPRSGGK